MSISYINRSREGENMAYNEGINDLKVNRWNGTDPEDGLPAQIEFWREHFEDNCEPDKLAEFNEYVRREGLEEMTTKTEYRTLDTTDRNEFRVGDQVTISRPPLPEMGKALDGDHYVFEYVADGTWTLRRLVVEETE